MCVYCTYNAHSAKTFLNERTQFEGALNDDLRFSLLPAGPRKRATSCSSAITSAAFGMDSRFQYR